MAHHYAQSYAKKDFYKLLRVPSSATTAEIKASYRKIAMELHPDRNDGCDIKSTLFKQINEAYNVLMDTRLRREYDQVHGIYFRRVTTEHTPLYRKVYAPSPPPEWKGKVWDHTKHYDYHYGDGFQKEAFDQLRKQAEEDIKHKRGPYHYESPLGKGFSFGDDDDTNTNPYSKRSPQGPPKMIFDYEESYIHMDTGKQHLRRRNRIVYDLHARRGQRLQRTKTTSTTSSSNDRDAWQEFVSPLQGANMRTSASYSASTRSTGSSHRNKNANECVIL